MTISSYEDLIVRNARFQWFHSLEAAINEKMGKCSQATCDGIRRTAERIEAVLHLRFTDLQKLEAQISDLELDIQMTERNLSDSGVTAILFDDPFQNVQEESVLSFPSCIIDLDDWERELEDSPLMYKALVAVRNLYTRVMNKKLELRHQTIELSEKKRRLQDRLQQYVESMKTDDDNF